MEEKELERKSLEGMIGPGDVEYDGECFVVDSEEVEKRGKLEKSLEVSE